MLKVKYPDIVKPEYLTCCSIHVRDMATYIAGFYLITEFFLIIFCPQAGRFYGGGLIFLALTLLYADIAVQPCAYWPFLIVKGITVILVGLASVIVTFVSIVLISSLLYKFFMPLKFCNLNSYFLRQNMLVDFDFDYLIMIILIIILTIIFVASLVFHIWQWYVVYRAKNYMITEVISGNTKIQVETMNGDVIVIV
uniref:Uncharacterized protein n=1 Tax=Panagrolaimus sp. JU765 TaxID=591449 RepID=A0AC34REJ0_9BILA